MPCSQNLCTRPCLIQSPTSQTVCRVSILIFSPDIRPSLMRFLPLSFTAQNFIRIIYSLSAYSTYCPSLTSWYNNRNIRRSGKIIQFVTQFPPSNYFPLSSATINLSPTLHHSVSFQEIHNSYSSIIVSPPPHGITALGGPGPPYYPDFTITLKTHHTR